jgi:arylsulfatase A-like enzyme
VSGLERYHGTETFLTDALTKEAIRLVDDAVAAGQPLFLHLSHHAVHAPLARDRRYYEEEIGRGCTDTQAKYNCLVRGVDDSLGELVNHLETLEIADKTIVIFCSDNGGYEYEGVDNAPLRGKKGTAYDGGLRVPLIVKWPGVVAAGGVCDANTVAEDIYPTLASVAGAAIEESYRPKVDGRDLSPLFKQQRGFDEERPIYFHQPHYHDHGSRPFSAVIQNQWKLILWHEDSAIELYDLSTDLSEAHDLAESQPERARGMLDTLAAYLRRVDAQLPRRRRSGESLRIDDLVRDSGSQAANRR